MTEPNETGSTKNESLRNWDGADGDYWAVNADRFDLTLERYMPHLLAAADLTAGERALDVGCGNGHTTLEAARRTSPGRAMGLDLSVAMLEVARLRSRERQVANVEFVHGDATVYPFEPAGFDVVVSRCGVMFFAEPEKAFVNIGRAVRPEGRLAFMVWQGPDANPWMKVLGQAVAPDVTPPAPPPGTPGPLSLADPARVRELLDAAGFADAELTAVAEPMCYGRDVDSAFDFLAGQPVLRPLMKDLDEAARAEGLRRLRATVEERMTPEGMLLDSAAWIVTAVRA